VLRRIFRPKRDEIIEGWRKLHSEELYNLYSSPNIIKMIKSRRTRPAGHVARVGRRGLHVKFWWESQKERSLGKSRRMWNDNNMMDLREIRWGGMDWIRLA
jgi:hypothetical protein